MPENNYDLIIIGTGAAGLAASIYASRYKINHLVIGQKTGGLAAWSHMIENYPGTLTITGQDLMNKFMEHAKHYGAPVIESQVLEVKKENDLFKVTLPDNKIFWAKALVLALGTERKKLGVPGEQEFWGRGVTYCATCDAPLYKNRTVAVVGGGDSALTAALLLASYAQKVYLIHRRDQFAGQEMWQHKVAENSKIVSIFSTNILEIKGDKVVKELILDRPYENSTSLPVNGVFIEIGSTPSIYLTKQLNIDLDDHQYIKVDNNNQTNLEGVFAAGDVTNQNHLKQILTAASQGAVAAYSAYKFLFKK
ncbi:MAG: FAD-dependent oxidoreductase [Patescibacteria group bacterium]|nr:FAD-dependent oxidoreductase [Patescibacteria group bacterium]MDD5121159.1 FAD-dependent oxidoreductase [Patescibacteria group bacterium]MDD5221674.1 FAD-dependent oxidoreductase [Patescibacteria group bacterium]MDD5395922.1 FAD-dependent oxidoreductase [Patescibacteria group bacterium]